MTENNKISLLLATYNGEKYLRQQLDSLFNQTYKNWNLWIRDDGSQDETLNIIDEYVNRYDNIFLLEDNEVRKGAKNSFFYLLQNVDSDYYMFCDQDDVWLPEKIEKTWQRMFLVEKQKPNKPVLINTNLMVVDENLNTISTSMWRDSKVNPGLLQHFNYLSVYNLVTGCTMMINKLAKEVSFPVNKKAIMHDSWIALQTLAHDGIISFIEEPTILYRQHEKNAIGTKKIDNKYILSKLRQLDAVVKDNVNQYEMVNHIRKTSLLKYTYYKFLYYLKR